MQSSTMDVKDQIHNVKACLAMLFIDKMLDYNLIDETKFPGPVLELFMQYKEIERKYAEYLKTENELVGRSGALVSSHREDIQDYLDKITGKRAL